MPGETQPLTRIPAPRPAMADGWYRRSPDAVAVALGVHPDVGLSAAKAADLLRDNGPNALPEEKPSPAGGGSSTSTAPTCRSSWSSRRSCRC